MIQQQVFIGIGSGGVGTSTTSLVVNFSLATTGEAINFEIFNANSPATLQSVNLVSGNNTFNTTTCPALLQAGAVMIIPPTGNGEALTIKGITADTGLSISPVMPTTLGLSPTPLTSFVINSAGTVTGLQLLFF